MSDMRQWFVTAQGERVLNTQQAVIDQLLSGFFGYHLLQMSVQSRELFGASQIRHKFAMGDAFLAEGEKLPFEDDSLDVILLHHLLDYHSSPQNLLREIARVSLPMGQLVIIGFNPLSWWGMWKPFAALKGSVPWDANFIRPGRLMDWLNLLNFKIDRAQYCIYGLPMSRKAKGRTPDYSQGLSRNTNWPFGAVYVIVARKQVATMIPIKPVWNRGQAFGQLSVVRPGRPAAGRGISTTRNLPPGD